LRYPYRRSLLIVDIEEEVCMSSKTFWILVTLILIAIFTGLVMAYKVYGFIVGVSLGLLFLFGLNRYHRWRASLLLQSILPGETLISNGLVSESTYDEVAAILVRGAGSKYRLLVADKRGAVNVQSVTSELKGHENPYDLKRYIEVNTIQGPMHFASTNRALVAGQPAYAQQILNAILVGEFLATNNA